MFAALSGSLHMHHMMSWTGAGHQLDCSRHGVVLLL